MDNKLKNDKVVLVVDDLFENLLILKRMLEKCGYSPMTASSANDALDMIKLRKPELILLDVYMPKMDGFELCEILKKDVTTSDIPIIFISAGMSKEDKIKGFEMGAVDFINKPFSIEEVSLRVDNHIHLYEMQRDNVEHNKMLSKMVQDHAIKIKEEQRNTIYALKKMYFLHFPKDEEISERISYNCRFLAQALEFSEKYEKRINQIFIELIGDAVTLHDIGKIAASSHTEKCMGHEETGARFLEDMSFLSEHNELLSLAIDGARYHNARWDGNGYPTCMKGEEIPLVARILSVCILFDQVCTEYKAANTEATDIEIKQYGVSKVLEKSGVYFEPEIVNIFSQVSRQFKI